MVIHMTVQMVDSNVYTCIVYVDKCDLTATKERLDHMDEGLNIRKGVECGKMTIL